MNSIPTHGDPPRDAGYWATPVHRLKVPAVPTGAINLNVDGCQVMGPLQGFGQLWQKRYRIRLTGIEIDPQAVIRIWKANFARFWPPGNQFYGTLTRITPGEVAVLNLSGYGGIRLATGVMVIYADEESFAFMDPEGHMYAAIITFSAFAESGATVAQVEPLLRANDPLYEIGMRLGIVQKMEDQFWHDTLRNLAAYFGANGTVEQRTRLLDPRVQWSQAKNIWRNAAVRTMLYTLTSPARRFYSSLKGRRRRRR